MTEMMHTMPNSNGSTHVQSKVFETLSEIGCCKMCTLRFCGETKVDEFRNLYKAIEDKRHCRTSEKSSDSESCAKVLASNPCVACLGMLQPPMCNKIIDKIVDAVSREEYDNPIFNVAFTLPVSFYLRANAVLVFLANNYPDHIKENLPLGLVTVGVKEAWKYLFAEKLSKLINKTFNNDADLRVQVDVQYEDDHSEIKCLRDMYPDKFKEQKIRSRRLRNVKGPSVMFSRKSVETVLGLSERDRFAQFYPVPPPVPTHAAICNNILFEQGCLYIAGRYYKYVRGLPQTAWMVHDERKLETSVHELIAERVQAVTKSQSTKLIASGREDVDVRMLGSGRPFALELCCPRHVRLTAQEMLELQTEINSDGNGKVSVSHLKVVPKSSLELLKKGEEKKTKTYVAYCAAWGVDEAKLVAVGTQAPLTLQQKTPVRVLHRRPIATRPKTVHWMTVSDIKHSPDDNMTYFKLTLNTQAGTYIKEFVHGDFGRTKPSLGDLMGAVPADCLALDVQSIELDWPPE